jgi:hypothetical protein
VQISVIRLLWTVRQGVCYQSVVTRVHLPSTVTEYTRKKKNATVEASYNIVSIEEMCINKLVVDQHDRYAPPAFLLTW